MIEQTKDDKVLMQWLDGMNSKEQAEIIAQKLSSISNLYQPLKSHDIEIPDTIDSAPHPLFEPYQVYKKAFGHK